MSILSDEIRAMVRPQRTFKALAAEKTETREDWRRLGGKVFFLLLSLGALVSLTASGRLVASHLAFTMVFWGFVPVIQLGLAAAAVRLVAPKGERLPKALSMFLVGHAPWFALFVVASALCLFASDVYATMMGLLSIGVLPGLVLIAYIWGWVLTFAFFRGGLGLGRGRAWIGTLSYQLGHAVVVIAYYAVTDQIGPQLFGVPA